LSSLLSLFADNLLPIFLAAGIGVLISRFLNTNPRPLSQVIFYVFSPCLVFNLITHSQLSDGDILHMMLFAGLMCVLIGTLTWLAGHFFRLERRMMAAVLLTSIFMNAGNFGLSLNNFAFGETTLSYASLYFVTTSVLTYTIGIIIASMGTATLKQAVINLFKIPAIYALVMAFIFLRTGWDLPVPLDRTTSLLGDASIPSMLILLGMQLKSVKLKGSLVPLALTNVMRLLVAPALALLLSLAFGFQGPAQQAAVLESAMPAAVITTVLATEYDVEPSYVTAAVFSTTLLSALTLTPILAFLGG
jgi:predicted permease